MLRAKILKTVRIPVILNEFIMYKIAKGDYVDYSEAIVSAIMKETLFDSFEDSIDVEERKELEKLRVGMGM